MSTQQQPEPEPYIPREIAYASVGAGAMLATSTVLANFVDFEPDLIGPAVVGGLGVVGTIAAACVTGSFLRADERATGNTEFVGVVSALALGASATAWMTYAQVMQSTGGVGQWLSAAGIAAVAAVTAILHRLHLQSVTEGVIEQRRQDAEEQRLGMWSKILRHAGHTCDITDEDGVKRQQLTLDIVEEDEHEFGYSVRVRGTDPASFKRLFWEGSDEAIGIAAMRVLGEDSGLTTASVTIDRTRTPGYAVINLLTRDIITEKLTWDDPEQHTAGEVTEPVRVGRYVNADVIRLHLFKKHMQVLGESQSGKSSLINTLIRRWIRCRNALVWIGGKWKLPRSVMPWLGGMNHAGGQRRPVLDWVAPNQQRILEMLATALEESAARESDPEFLQMDKPTETYPQIEIVLDECQHTLQDETTIRCHDGIKRTAGQLVDILTSGGTSSFIRVTFSTQSALFADMGMLGGRIKSNISISIAFRSGRDDFLEKVITGVKASMNKTHLITAGAMLVQQGSVPQDSSSNTLVNHSVARLGKAEYISPAVIPETAAACSELGGRMPTSRAEAFTVATLGGSSAYQRRFHFSDGSQDEFFKAIAQGDSYRDSSYTQTAPQNQPPSPQPQKQVTSMDNTPGKITSENAREFGLDPNMSLADAVKGFERAKSQRDMHTMSDEHVESEFAALTEQASAGVVAGPSAQRPAPEPRTEEDMIVPEIVEKLIELFPAEEFKTFTGHEAAIALGMITSGEQNEERIREAREAVGNEIYEAIGLRSGQHRDPRHIGRRRCFRVMDLEQARQDLLDEHHNN